MARYGFGGSRGATGAHLKSMGSYELHAWRDAMAIGALLDELVGASRARQIYEQVKPDALKKFERSMCDDIANFISRSESQRPSVVRKLPDEVTKVCFMVLSMLGCVRAKRIMEIRDSYREVLAPGRGNRETTGSLYQFSMEVISSFDYEWPGEVFDAFGVDDEGDADEDDDPAPTQAPQKPVAPVMPVVPPPPPPIVPAEHTEVLVCLGPCDVVRATADAEGHAWAMQLVEEHSGRVSMWLGASAIQREGLIKTLINLGERTWGPKPTLLVFSPAQRGLVEAINSAAGREVAAVARKGVMAMAFTRWPDEMLCSVRRELEIIDEPMPAAEELMKAVDPQGNRLLSFKDADPKADWQAQRDEVEQLVRAILALRGRHLGPIDSPAPGFRSAGSASRDIAKAKREVNKLEYSNRTALGDGLLDISKALIQWRGGECSASAAMELIGPVYLEYKFRVNSDGFCRLAFELKQYFGAGSAEMDLVEAAVLRQLGGSFWTGSRPPEPKAVRYGAPFSLGIPLSSPNCWFNAWWCVFDGLCKEAVDKQLWLPAAEALTDAANAAVSSQGGSVRVDGSLYPMSRLSMPSEQRWVDADVSIAQDEGGQLVRWLGGDRYRPYSGSAAAESCTRWGVLVVARGPTKDVASSIRHSCSAEIASSLLSRIRDKDRRGKRQDPPRTLSVIPASVDFLAPLQQVSCRLALMSGRVWDSATRTSILNKPART